MPEYHDPEVARHLPVVSVGIVYVRHIDVSWAEVGAPEGTGDETGCVVFPVVVRLAVARVTVGEKADEHVLEDLGSDVRDPEVGADEIVEAVLFPLIALRANRYVEWVMLRVLLYGIGSDKRLEYEENVLLDIVKDYNGSAREAPCQDETNIMAADAICANVVGGRFSSEVSYESINQATRYSNEVDKITDIHRPPILQEYNTTDWICPYELGYIAKMECLRMAAVEDNYALNEWKKEVELVCAEKGAYALVPNNEVFGPVWGNYPQREDGIRKIFDPNCLSAPE